MNYADKTMSCSDCNSDFIFSAGEQEFFAAKALTNLPKRCPNCRVLSRLKRSGKEVVDANRVMCADCSALVVVPFKPAGHSPVYCVYCLRVHREALVTSAVESSLLTVG